MTNAETFEMVQEFERYLWKHRTADKASNTTDSEMDGVRYFVMLHSEQKHD